jgi:hypothetical protein
VNQSKPTKTYRVTWDELMSRRSEIAPNAVPEVKVYEPEAAPQADPENQALVNLLQSWREEDATDDPQEMERRDVETGTIMSSLQANRLSLCEPEA